MSSLSNFVTWVQEKLSFPTEIDEPAIENAIDSAIVILSRIKPRIAIVDFTGNNSAYDFTLPSSWVEGFSTVLSVEYPSGKQSPIYIKTFEYRMYQSATGTIKFRLVNDTPSATDTVRVSYSAPWEIDSTSSTVLAQDVRAVVDLAASICAQELSAKAAQTQVRSLDADAINYLAKVDHWSSISKRLESSFKRHVGVSEDSWIKATSKTTEIDSIFPWGVENITHPRSWQ